jgi:hypothetical protein
MCGDPPTAACATKNNILLIFNFLQSYRIAMSWSTGEKLAFGIIVVIILVFLGIFAYENTRPAPAAPVPPPAPVPNGGSSAPPTTPAKAAIKYIDFVKDTSVQRAANAANPENWTTFQIGEVKLYDGSSNYIPRSAVDSIVWSPTSALHGSFYAANIYDNDPTTFSHNNGADAIQKITVTLVAPTPLSKITVLNRQDCCQMRLAGVLMNLYDANKNLIVSYPLTAEMTQDYTVSK